MASSLSVLSILSLLAGYSAAIECYSGLKLISGQSVGSETIQCDNSGSQCYNMTASAAVVLDVVKAGCSLWRCMLAKDRCISTTFQNIPISLCCCSSDRCNVGENVGMKHIGGWNAENPGHREDQLTKEEVHSRFSSAEVDDDLPTTASRGNRHGGPSERPRGAPGRELDIE